jgi:predicted phage baseplate assembly protein
MVITGADGTTNVQFGDGVTGALPGSGTNNIIATYRQGIGRAGLVRAGQINQLLSRPPGLKAVLNPIASNGAADPETLEQARPNAPISVKTLERVVTLADFGDFAAASGAIGKAAATWIWDGTRSVVCVTVADVGGAPVVPGSDQATHLMQALLAAGDGSVPVALCPYVSKTFTIAATVTPDPSLDASAVLDGVKSALRQAFGFAPRAFGQPVGLSEVIAVIQAVPGVLAMSLSTLAFTGSTGIVDLLPAAAPMVGSSGLVGAELLTLEPGLLPGVVLTS